MLAATALPSPAPCPSCTMCESLGAGINLRCLPPRDRWERSPAQNTLLKGLRTPSVRCKTVPISHQQLLRCSGKGSCKNHKKSACILKPLLASPKARLPCNRHGGAQHHAQLSTMCAGRPTVERLILVGVANDSSAHLGLESPRPSELCRANSCYQCFTG